MEYGSSPETGSEKIKRLQRPLSLSALSFKGNSGVVLPKAKNQLRILREKGKVVQVIINYSKSTESQMISQSST